MNKSEFIAYVEKNFDVSGEFGRLLVNVLTYAEQQGWSEDETYVYLSFMLDGTIGLSDAEIRKINL